MHGEALEGVLLDVSMKMDILLVEDNEADVWLFSDFLHEMEPEATLNQVSDGVEAIDYLFHRDQYKTAHRPDIVVLDLNLPRKDGRAVLAEMKANPDIQDIPVIVVTGGTVPEDKELSFRLGAAAYYHKEFRLDQYRQLMETLTKEEFPRLVNHH